MHSLRRSQCNRLNVVSMTKIRTVKKRLQQINKEDDDYATGIKILGHNIIYRNLKSE